MATAAMNLATLAVAKAAQRKLVHIMHKALAADGIYAAEVTVCGGVSAGFHASMPECHVFCVADASHTQADLVGYAN